MLIMMIQIVIFSKREYREEKPSERFYRPRRKLISLVCLFTWQVVMSIALHLGTESETGRLFCHKFLTLLWTVSSLSQKKVRFHNHALETSFNKTRSVKKKKSIYRRWCNFMFAFFRATTYRWSRSIVLAF